MTRRDYPPVKHVPGGGRDRPRYLRQAREIMLGTDANGNDVLVIDGKEFIIGVPGARGPQGTQGIPGASGPPGIDGADGTPGLTGAIGPQGSPGAPGFPGDSGEEGPMGVPGPPGTVGAQGTQGIQGPPGDVGEEGPVGFPGPPGSIGPQGPQGFMGPLGLDGEDGSMGIQGPPGAQGVQGVQGAPGLVAPSWTIDGADGAPGDVGPVGPQGPIGLQGLPGLVAPTWALDGADGEEGFPAIPVSNHGALSGLTNDDHTQYLKEKASGGVASEVPTHTHQSAAEAGTLDTAALASGILGTARGGTGIDAGAAWSSWTPTFGGFSIDPVVMARYVQIGKIVYAVLTTTGGEGTSNSTTFTITLPVAPKISFNGLGSRAVDNGVLQVNVPRLSSTAGSTTLTIYKDMAASSWTNTGAKSADFILVYEAN